MLAYISTVDYVCKIRKACKGMSYEDIRDQIHAHMLPSVSFRGLDIETSYIEHNQYKKSGIKVRRYQFICPSCKRKAMKLYIKGNSLSCYKCNRENLIDHIRTDQDRMLVIKRNMQVLFHNHNLTAKNKKKLKEQVVNCYKDMSDFNKIVNNNIVFKELTSWCENVIKDESKSQDYRLALKDMLYYLKNMREIMLKAKLLG